MEEYIEDLFQESVGEKDMNIENIIESNKKGISSAKYNKKRIR